MANYLDKLERLYAKNRDEWHQWLSQNHVSSPGVWLIYYKKNSAKPRVLYEEAVEEALSFGWIDSKVNTLDDERYMQVFTPRKPGSIWSKTNKERIRKLVQNGQMQPAGLKKVEEAKQNGSWSFLDDIDDLIIPDDLNQELLKQESAQKNFNNYSESLKKQILYWIKTAKRKETRKQRIDKIVDSAEKNEIPF